MDTLQLTQIFIGDSVDKRISLNDYKSSEWDLKYDIGNVTLPFSADGDGFLLLSAITIDAGIYNYRAYLTHKTSSQKITLITGRVEIISLDYKSHARKVLEAINATIESKATNIQSEMSINGRAIKYYSLSDLLKLQSLYERKVQSEEDKERSRAGIGSRNKVKVRF